MNQRGFGPLFSFLGHFIFVRPFTDVISLWTKLLTDSNIYATISYIELAWTKRVAHLMIYNTMKSFGLLSRLNKQHFFRCFQTIIGFNDKGGEGKFWHFMVFILTASQIIVKSVYTYIQKIGPIMFLLTNIHKNIYLLIRIIKRPLIQLVHPFSWTQILKYLNNINVPIP